MSKTNKLIKANENSIIENMQGVNLCAARLDCSVVAVLDNVVLCYRADNTFITWRVLTQAARFTGEPSHVEFISGCYDMDRDTGRANLIERAYEYIIEAARA